jgi:succinate dehydrogenase/fumarate reductase-like Fe-S protein
MYEVNREKKFFIHIKNKYHVRKKEGYKILNWESDNTKVTQKQNKKKKITTTPACMQCAYCYAQFCPYPYI